MFKLKVCNYGTDILRYDNSNIYRYVTGSGYFFSWKQENLIVKGYL